MTFRRELTFYDVTNMTVGAIVGADIYIASAITAGILGPASLLAWAIAGALATILALTLAECARVVPSVGGPYAYASVAFGRFPGFVAGWSMWIAELTALPVFAIAFTNYLGYFVAADYFTTHAIRLLFLALLTLVNVASVRLAGRVNDALTALKLAPLVVIVIAGVVYAVVHPAEVAAHLEPFAPFGLDRFPSALVLVFWAYAGFELATVPAGEVADPERTIPRALAAGMAIVTVFYLSTNTVVYGLVDHRELATNAAPLILVGTVLFGSLGAGFVAVGAMISVSGSDESDMLGSSRLAYAMAADGLLPHRLAELHPRFATPYVALIVQGLAAGGLTFVDRIPDLIGFAVVNLSLAFLLCALALIRLHRREVKPPSAWNRVVPLLAILISVGLLVAAPRQDKITGAVVLAAGVLVYVAGAPRVALPEALAEITSTERVLWRLARTRLRFLGGPIGWLRGHRSPPSRPHVR
ncbi:MAG: amino acid permease [Dehalococcoidia bacterium]